VTIKMDLILSPRFSSMPRTTLPDSGVILSTVRTWGHTAVHMNHDMWTAAA
jgi:hypothetical protein